MTTPLTPAEIAKALAASGASTEAEIEAALKMYSSLKAAITGAPAPKATPTVSIKRTEPAPEPSPAPAATEQKTSAKRGPNRGAMNLGHQVSHKRQLDTVELGHMEMSALRYLGIYTLTHKQLSERLGITGSATDQVVELLRQEFPLVQRQVSENVVEYRVPFTPRQPMLAGYVFHSYRQQPDPVLLERLKTSLLGNAWTMPQLEKYLAVPAHSLYRAMDFMNQERLLWLYRMLDHEQRGTKVDGSGSRPTMLWFALPDRRLNDITVPVRATEALPELKGAVRVQNSKRGGTK